MKQHIYSKVTFINAEYALFVIQLNEAENKIKECAKSGMTSTFSPMLSSKIAEHLREQGFTVEYCSSESRHGYMVKWG